MKYCADARVNITKKTWGTVTFEYVSVSAPHRVEMNRNVHTLKLFDGVFDKGCPIKEVRSSTWMGYSKIADKRSVTNMVDLIPADTAFEAECYENGTLWYKAISLSTDMFLNEDENIYFTSAVNVFNPLIGRLASSLENSDNILHAQSLAMAMFMEANVSVKRQFSERIALTYMQRKLLIEYIEDHINEPLELNDLAAIVGLSIFHFSRQFKKCFRLTPYQYVLHRRLEKVKGFIISSPDIPLSKIAIMCGFNSPSYFSQAFRRYFGMSPSRFRRDV